MTTNILNLKKIEVLKYFLDSRQYHSFELPEYFDFDRMLKSIKSVIGAKKYEDCICDNPERCAGVNLGIMLNKDGAYGLRPLQLTNPVLYYFLSREIADNWQAIKDCFESFKVPHIASCAMPVVVKKGKEPFHKSSVILNWWTSMEQRSIELSLQFRYMFITDITNCYGSIDPTLFRAALNREGTDHAVERNSELSGNLQKYLRAMQGGRNIGIPQGSALFDFIGEIILGYSDLLLYEALNKNGISDGYEILRYRDDYRIFCNDRDLLERISYILQSVLENLNFRMNVQKTKISESVIIDSIKKDKLSYIYNTPVFNKKGCDFDSFEKHLLYILMFGRQYPNGGQLKVLLSDLSKRITEWIEPVKAEVGDTVPLTEEEEKETIWKKLTIIKKLPGGSVEALVAVATQIGIENISVVHYSLRIISQILTTLKTPESKIRIVNMVRDRFILLPNSDYVQIWLQNLTYPYDAKRKEYPYTHMLCRMVAGCQTCVWNMGWLIPELLEKLNFKSIIQTKKLRNLEPIINFKENRLYDETKGDVPYREQPAVTYMESETITEF